MTPPTGLTFIVHALIVLIRKILAFFGVDTIQVPSRVKASGRLAKGCQKCFSAAIVVFVAIYMSWLVSTFVVRAVHDKHANWKVAGKTIATIENTIDRFQPPKMPAAMGENQSDLYVPYRFFSEKSSPYISLYMSPVTFHYYK